MTAPPDLAALVKRLRDGIDASTDAATPPKVSKIMSEAADALEACARDAARYRWLREHDGGVVFWPSVWMSPAATMPLQALFLDAAIDGARGEP